VKVVAEIAVGVCVNLSLYRRNSDISLTIVIKLNSCSEWVATDNVAGNAHTYTINVCDRIYSISEAREKVRNAGCVSSQ
jgi:hypothetical protein